MSAEYPIKGMTVMPSYMGELPMIEGAFVACVIASAGEPRIIARFEEESKLSLTSVLRAKGLNAMIDESTGYRAKVLASFADWIAVNVWGVDP